MKRFVFFLLVGGVTAALFAQVDLPEHEFAVGSWSFIGDRVYQTDVHEALAKTNLKIPQSGAMLYEFDVRYEGGAEDGHGGFGIHIFADRATKEPSWGVGKSWLIWLNYDESPVKGSKIPVGLSGQVYRSTSNSAMELVYNVDLNNYQSFLTTDFLNNPIHIKIYANGDSGEIRIYDPTEEGKYYGFTIDEKYLPLKGDWAAVRTNCAKFSFAMSE
ncbi:MAG: hypothetical protein LBH75_04950 [Treponema sp.]|jgi:hypothetical protein|nr:hypothetical protein [Treponema sp.]